MNSRDEQTSVVAPGVDRLWTASLRCGSENATADWKKEREKSVIWNYNMMCGKISADLVLSKGK